MYRVGRVRTKVNLPSTLQGCSIIILTTYVPCLEKCGTPWSHASMNLLFFYIFHIILGVLTYLSRIFCHEAVWTIEGLDFDLDAIGHINIKVKVEIIMGYENTSSPIGWNLPKAVPMSAGRWKDASYSQPKRASSMVYPSLKARTLHMWARICSYILFRHRYRFCTGR